MITSAHFYIIIYLAYERATAEVSFVGLEAALAMLVHDVESILTLPLTKI